MPRASTAFDYSIMLLCCFVLKSYSATTRKLCIFRSNTTNILQTKPAMGQVNRARRHPQAHPLVIQPPSSTSSAVALFAILTERHILRNFAVEARSFSVTFALSVRRLSTLPSVSCATLTGDETYDSSKRGFPVRRRYFWSIKCHRWG